MIQTWSDAFARTGMIGLFCFVIYVVFFSTSASHEQSTKNPPQPLKAVQE